MLMGKKFILLAAVLAALSANSWAQPESDNHPELNWFSIETEHFLVHFHDGAERTAKVVAKIAEDVYGPVTSLYQYEPGSKFHFIIRDHDDYANGAAFYYDNKLEIWATALDFELRGSHNWLRNVITHEFTHMIQLQSARKITQRIPAIYFQAIGYEEDRRVDVLHGGPNVIASYPLSMTVMPNWFAEGVAQYQLPGLDYDTWDSHRDMILRTAALDNQLLTYNEMGVFGKKGIGNEKVYNHGYAFVTYLAEKYGIETLRNATRNMSSLFSTTFDGALKKATGKSGPDLYDDWTAHLQSRYSSSTQNILANRVEGKIIEAEGVGNFYPTWSPDGDNLAYLSSRGNDGMSQTGIWIYSKKPAKIKSIGGGKFSYSLSWSPDGTELAFADQAARGEGGSHYFDLYIGGVKSGKKRRVTNGLRATSPDWSGDGKDLVFIISSDGTENLASLNLETNELDTLTNFRNGEQLSHPRWSPNNERVLFGLSKRSGQDLYFLDIATGELAPLLDDPADSRDAVFSPDGGSIYFSWDKTGIFNIYSMNLETKETTQWTNTVGGAFMPSLSQSGELAFALFTSDGYKISVLENPQPIDPENANYVSASKNTNPVVAQNGAPHSSLEKIDVRNFDDSQLPDYTVKPYGTHYSPIAFLPRVMIDYGTVKLGSYFYSYDVLDKYGFLAGFDVNRHGDYDLFALIDYRNFGPTLFLELYNQVQNTDVAVDSIEIIRRQLPVDEADDKFRYNLIEADLGLRFKIGDVSELRTAFVFSRYSARAKFREFFGEQTFSYNYFIGRDFSFKFTHYGLKRTADADISPRGRQFTIGYDFQLNKFLSDFAVNDAFLDEVYDNHNYHQFTLDWQEHLGLPIKSHTLNLDIQAGFIPTEVDSFFNFFGGGILGNRGYPYFSIEGRKLLLGRATYRFPLFRHIDRRIKHLYFDKLFLGLFYDYGNAFNESKIDLGDFKSSVGVQLRMDMFSFYAYPTRFFFNAAYGLDEFKIADQTYGKEWRFYFGLSFGYLD
jgi:Tol biopolymer transport system component